MTTEISTAVKFSEFEYKRPDINIMEKELGKLLGDFKKCSDAVQLIEIIREINLLRTEFESMQRIASVRYTIDTEDAFYNEEHDYFDEISPIYKGLINDYYKCLVNSKFRFEIEKKFGIQLFNIAGTELKTFSNEIREDLKMENQLVTRYVKLISSAKINFEGEDRNLAGMDLFMQSTDRATRKKACEARWKFFEKNEEEIDSIFDELVKVRTTIARKLGYDNFIQLGYDRLHRTGYTIADIENFRITVKEFFLPLNEKLSRMKKDRLGLDKIYYYDAGFNFINGDPVPKGSPEWILEKAKKMYEELSPETENFINVLIEHEVLDLYNRENKSPGGYCTAIYKYRTPFIFANLNGTDHDVKVFTHEAGHAFQFFESMHFEIPEYMHSTLEAAEIHSMSMEFITWPWMHLFFEEDTDKFLYSHLSKALKFVPYGVTVDEFQHFAYGNPDATKEDRKRKWRELEEKYTPGLDYSGNDFLERGGAWFHKAHIFRTPFYYIDYCLAQVCALHFWKKCNYDRESAWNDYLRLCKEGGSKSFLELLKTANLDSPFEKITVKSIIDYADKWIENSSKTLKLD